MKARARGFLLISFAFSSLLTSAENVNPSKVIETKPPDSGLPTGVSHPPAGGPTSTKPIDHELEKRAAEVYRGDTVSGTTIKGTGPSGDDTAETCCGGDAAESFIDKRSLRNYKELFGGKRAPLAFHGMRGKKSEETDGTEWSRPDVLDMRDLPSNQRYLIGTGLLEDGDDPSVFDYPELLDKRQTYDQDPVVKRSPYSFQGMRGKKATDYDLKRAMGFLGMRGKKSPEIWYADDYKRAPQTSFFGMKGKRAQGSGFFGMRGKKPSLGPFYGIQGLREPLGRDFQGIHLLDQIKEGESSTNRFRRAAPGPKDDTRHGSQQSAKTTTGQNDAHRAHGNE